MASTSGLTRRRGAASNTISNDDDEPTASASINATKRNDDPPETQYESSENGHKIAFDPRDLSDSAERRRQPKLTLMEEVLLMGLKDKQVGIPMQCMLAIPKVY